MTVTGNVTATQAAASYTPPFQYVTSYPPAALVTGTATNLNPSVPTASGSNAADYVNTYLDIHMMSSSSYRYAYLLWLFLALFAAIYTASHQLRVSNRTFGAIFAKWAMKRHRLGNKNGRFTALPSNGVILTAGAMSVVICVLCVVGPDYVAPASSAFDFKRSIAARSSGPLYTISKAFWTSGSRFGFMAFAMAPLIVLLALKAPPFALLSIRFLAQLYYDKLAFLHKALAWLMWVLTTVHVVLWTIQLLKDSYQGASVWRVIWSSYRFIFGFIAYGAMTLLVILSLKPLRKRRYEFFYISHVVLVIVTLVACAIHHPVLWYWMAIALGLWTAERTWRLIRFAHINGFVIKPSFVAGQPYSSVLLAEDIPFVDKSLPRLPRSANQDLLSPFDDAYEMDRRPNKQGNRGNDSTQNISQPQEAGPLVNPPPPVPVGYAQAQLLPSRTVRLTVRVARPFEWKPGQSVLLFLPDISRFQSHPFTITNNERGELVLLVKARKGITRHLYDLVRRRSLAGIGLAGEDNVRDSFNAMSRGQSTVRLPPIYVRAWIDGPMGSAGRIRWNDYTSAVIVCGGSGVSFGVAVCEYLCKVMRRGGRTQRVRFCWVAREYAELAWVASQLCRCKSLVDSEQLQIDIYITNTPHVGPTELSPPRAPFQQQADSGRRASVDSINSELSQDGLYDDAADDFEAGLELGGETNDLDLTNYEDEDDVHDPAQDALSGNVQREGKVQRAKSRRRGQMKSGENPRSRYSSTVHASDPFLDSRSAEQQYAALAYDDLVSQSSRPTITRVGPRTSEDDSIRGAPLHPASRRDIYGMSATRTDPFADSNASRYAISRSSRTQSMVLLDQQPTSDTVMWIDQADWAAMSLLSESAKSGRPKLSQILDEEMATGYGKMIVATCGPSKLNAVVRNLVSKRLTVGNSRRNRSLAIYSEDYES